jgi:hypothetical protein
MMAAEVEALERRQQTHLVEQGVLEKMEAEPLAVGQDVHHMVPSAFELGESGRRWWREPGNTRSHMRWPSVWWWWKRWKSHNS